MKRDLRLTDTQMGILIGPAFAIVYAVVSIPMASAADRGRRIKFIAWSLAFWSLMTGLCGLARSFPIMALGRFGVGAGEAGGAPSINAIAAETFPAKYLATALAAIVTAGNIGGASALVLGGLIADGLGWRSAFFCGAAAGMMLALALSAMSRGHRPLPPHSNLGVTKPVANLIVLFRRPAFAYLCAGMGLVAIGVCALTAWSPAFLMRKFDVSTGDVGRTYGVIHGVMAIFVPLAAGFLTDRLSRKDTRWPIWLLIAIFLTSIPMTIAFLFAPTFLSALILTVPTHILMLAFGPAYYALVQDLSGPAFRSMGAAISAAVVYLVGYGIGPPLIGLLSDLLPGALGGASLQNALMISLIGYAGGAVMFVLSARHVIMDREVARNWSHSAVRGCWTEGLDRQSTC
ncbi:MFS transporter [soil metagenome]